MKPSAATWACCLVLFALAAADAWAQAEYLTHIEAAVKAFQEQRFTDAAQEYGKALEDRALTGGRRAVTYLLRGEAYMEAGELGEAIQDFRRAARLKPNYAHAYYMAGRCYEERGKLREAYLFAQKALEYKPDNPTYQARLETIAARMQAVGLEIPNDGTTVKDHEN